MDGIFELFGGWSILYLSSSNSETISRVISTAPKQQFILEHFEEHIIFNIPNNNAHNAEIIRYVDVEFI